MLNNKLKSQVVIASWQLFTMAMLIVGYILIIYSLVGFSDVSSPNQAGSTYSFTVPTILGIIFTIVFGIANFVLWIVGIVNASQVQSLTGDSIVLVVFSVITLLIGHLIVAIIQKNKFYGTKPKLKTQFNQSSSAKDPFEVLLKKAFLDGLISSEEYQKKLEKQNNK